MSLTYDQRILVAIAANRLREQQINSHAETRRAAAKAIVIALLCDLECDEVADLFAKIDKWYA